MVARSDPLSHDHTARDETGGVAIVAWPAQAESLARLTEAGTPRLVVVECGHEPPVASECCQDWMWRDGSPHELRLRLRQLALRGLAHARTRPFLDGSGMLQVGLRSVYLTALEQRITGLLVERFNERVPADDVIAATWPGSTPPKSLLRPRISVLRRRVAAAGLELRGSLRDGYTLRPSPTPVLDVDEPSCFDAEVDAANWLNDERAS